MEDVSTNKPKIAIVGAGNAGSEYAKALIALEKTHEVIMLDTPQDLEDPDIKDKLEGVKHILPEDLLKPNDYIKEQVHVLRNYRDDMFDMNGLYDDIPKRLMNATVKPVRDSKKDPKISNNASCPCGSGMKYKRCCKGNTD